MLDQYLKSIFQCQIKYKNHFVSFFLVLFYVSIIAYEKNKKRNLPSHAKYLFSAQGTGS